MLNRSKKTQWFLVLPLKNLKSSFFYFYVGQINLFVLLHCRTIELILRVLFKIGFVFNMTNNQEHSINENDNSKTELFITLLSANHHRVYAFIFSLVPNNADADDIMQETSRVLWEKFDQFIPDTDFVAWAVTVAKYQVLSSRKKKKPTVSLSREIIDLISDESKKVLDESTERFIALRKCVAKLDEKGLMFVKMRYKGGFSARVIAQRIGVSIKTVYRNESRINGLLIRCIRRTLAGRDTL